MKFVFFMYLLNRFTRTVSHILVIVLVNVILWSEMVFVALRLRLRNSWERKYQQSTNRFLLNKFHTHSQLSCHTSAFNISLLETWCSSYFPLVSQATNELDFRRDSSTSQLSSREPSSYIVSRPSVVLYTILMGTFSHIDFKHLRILWSPQWC